jgi:Phosphotransferase enzyme family
MLGVQPGEASIEVKPLRGGLMADAVLRISARYQDSSGRSRLSSFVVKQLAGDAMREALIYEHLVASHAQDLAPRLLDIERSDGAAVLFLEAVNRSQAWPWRDVQTASSVLCRLAPLHASMTHTEATELLPAWDYDQELNDIAVQTWEAFDRARRDPELASLLAGRAGPLKRIIRALPSLRGELLAFGPVGSGPIHGDLHPGNVMMRRRAARLEPVFLDWGRARVGSPLEDVSSWLQSLGFFEPEAKRRHDTLLSEYLSARGQSASLSPDIRGAYWLAGASNAMAGALAYHLRIATDSERTAERIGAARAACDWLRVVRRADAFWS